MREILVTIPLDEEHKENLTEKAPEFSYTFKEVADLTDEELEKAEVIIGNISASQAKKAVSLKWLHLNTAGAENFTKPGVLREGVLLTNSSGAYGLAISEHMLGMLLMLMKKMTLYYTHQLASEWVDEGSVRSVYGSTVLILGFGDIGREFAKRVHALGATVIGVRKTTGEKPDYADELHTQEDLPELLPRADVVALSLPDTPETRHIINAESIGEMKDGAIVLNVGRGTAIDQDALADALFSGKLGGAGLDVTDPEPLPADSPLWKTPNTVITPHVSGHFHLSETYERIVRIAERNLEHYAKGEPLENVVDFATGYRKSVR